MVLIFDLDDTLYEELEFVKSGFRKVADFLADTRGINRNECYSKLCSRLEKGRGTIFDETLKEYGIYTKVLVKDCLKVYRYHKPEIQLYPDAYNCLMKFSHLPKYVVTDGNKLVQANKIRALGLEKLVRFSYITHRYGIQHSKPSTYVFQKICNREKVKPGKMLYIGDNPLKDFIGIKSIGIKTVRLIRGNYKELRLNEPYEADREIISYDEMTTDFLNNLFYEGNDH